ncbi:MAG TPA: class II aldolase/adducin family protein, partial [Chitinophagaceae bacterium]|nr:class II aldolase/adducin family protein [Chitinophagaceae bacterium]
MKEEGIKFNCNWIEAPAPADASIHELNEWRNKLYGLGLIGETADGIGYGNISRRLAGNTFIITGATTGKLPQLSNQHYTTVTDYNIGENRLTTGGPIKASSESLTHAMIYECDDQVQAVFHVHHKALWQYLLKELPSTDSKVPYGTPEMAAEIARLCREASLRDHKILAM